MFPDGLGVRMPLVCAGPTPEAIPVSVVIFVLAGIFSFRSSDPVRTWCVICCKIAKFLRAAPMSTHSTGNSEGGVMSGMGD